MPPRSGPLTDADSFVAPTSGDSHLEPLYARPAPAVVRGWYDRSEELLWESSSFHGRSSRARAEALALKVRVGAELIFHAYKKDGFEAALGISRQDADRCRACARAWAREAKGEPTVANVFAVWGSLTTKAVQVRGRLGRKRAPRKAAGVPLIAGNSASSTAPTLATYRDTEIAVAAAEPSLAGAPDPDRAGKALGAVLGHVEAAAPVAGVAGNSPSENAFQLATSGSTATGIALAACSASLALGAPKAPTGALNLEAAEAAAIAAVEALGRLDAAPALRSLRQRCDDLVELIGRRAGRRDLRLPLDLEDIVCCDDLKATLRGLARWNGPPPVILLWGPTGCGKSTLARAFAKLWIEAEKRSLFECSLYMEQVSAARGAELALAQIEGWRQHQTFALTLIVNEADRLLTEQQRLLDLLAGERGALPAPIVFTTVKDPAQPRETNRNLPVFDPQFRGRCTILEVRGLEPDLVVSRLREIAGVEGVDPPDDVLRGFVGDDGLRGAIKRLDAHLARIAGAASRVTGGGSGS